MKIFQPFAKAPLGMFGILRWSHGQEWPGARARDGNGVFMAHVPAGGHGSVPASEKPQSWRPFYDNDERQRWSTALKFNLIDFIGDGRVLTSRVIAASIFATGAHSRQTRKYTGEPYVNHCVAVAMAIVGIGAEENTIIAALLHDVVEDTPVTTGDILKSFGPRVALLVSQLTNVPLAAGNKERRHEIDRDRLAGADVDAKSIKLADIADNVMSVAARDPKYGRIYVLRKAELLDVLTDGHPVLFKAARTAIANAYTLLNSLTPMENA